MMSELDTDRGGFVNLGEFTVFHGRGHGDAEQEAELRTAFDVYDFDGDRHVTMVLQRLQPRPDYGLTFEKVPLFSNNTSAINIAKNHVQHSCRKHIDIRFHFLRDHVEKGDVELTFLDTKLQLADIFTKPLDSSRFAFLRGELGIIHPFGMV
uniref:EF-hand domain-containing protein n=1 Tax=Oryza brachyantha TaxID=4533 RepID=J3N7V4_ORYBR